MDQVKRVFCTKLSGVYLRKLLEGLQESGFECQLVDSSLDLDLESPIWSLTRLAFVDSSKPIILEHYIGGLHGTMMEEEMEKFLGMTETLEESMNKHEVMVYLRMTRELLIVRARGDVGRKTQEAIEYCISTFAKLGEGIVQVDGEGFYKKGSLVLRMPRE